MLYGYSWSYNGAVIPQNISNTLTGVVKMGNYTCEVINTAGVGIGSIFINQSSKLLFISCTLACLHALGTCFGLV